MIVVWNVLYDHEFFEEIEEESLSVQLELAKLVRLLQLAGPQLGRPHRDTLNGSRFSNMKELRFTVRNEA